MYPKLPFRVHMNDVLLSNSAQYNMSVVYTHMVLGLRRLKALHMMKKGQSLTHSMGANNPFFAAFRRLVTGCLLGLVLCAVSSCSVFSGADAVFYEVRQARYDSVYADTARLSDALQRYQQLPLHAMYGPRIALLTYQLGRNYEQQERYEEAAACYIEADQMVVGASRFRQSLRTAMSRLQAAAEWSTNAELIRAAFLVETYLAQPDPFAVWKVVVSFIGVVCLFVLVFFSLSTRQHRAHIQEKETLLAHQEERIVNLQEDRATELEHNILHLTTLYPVPSKAWHRYAVLRETVSPQLFHLMSKLEQTNALSEQEIVFCTYYLLYPNATLTEIAEWVHYSPKGIRTYKQRIAQKLHTTSANLAHYLHSLAISA